MRDFVWADPGLLRRRRRLLKVGASRTVDATADNVWNVIADHSTWPTWHADYDEHESITDHDDGLGARFRTKEWVLRSESEVSRWVPGRVIGLTVLRATAWRWLVRSYYTEISIEPIGDEPRRCRIRYDVAFTGTVLFWLLSAYAVGHALASIYWNAGSSLKNLERFLADGT